MSVLIKGMEMPKSCEECQFFTWKRGVGQHCAVDDRITFHATLDGFDVGYERNGDCPLVPVPPHGRLIDADKFKDYIMYGYESNKDLFVTEKYRLEAEKVSIAFCKDIDEQETIIPPEEEN